MEPSESAALRASQREAWSSVAAGWRKWWRVFEAGAQPLSDRLVELARVEPGSRVLDVATGIGEPAATAARRAGPSGSVLAFDLAPAMIALARERIAAAGLANVELCEADAPSPDLEPASFDAALSRWGLMLLPEPERALDAIRAASKPGARLAAAVWSTADRVPFIAIPYETTQRELDLPPAPPDAPGPTRYGRPGGLEALFAAAGFRDVRAERFDVAIEFASPAEYVAFLKDVSGGIKSSLADRPPDVVARVWSAIADASREHARAGGRIRFENESRIVVGVR